MAYHLADKFHRRNGGDLEEIRGEAFIGLCRAASTYQEGKGATFATWAYKLIGQHLLNWHTRRKPTHFQMPIDNNSGDEFEPICQQAGPDERAGQRDEQAKAVVAVGQIRDRLTDRQFTVLEMRVMEGQTLHEVGERFGITKERARQIQLSALKRARGALKERV